MIAAVRPFDPERRCAYEIYVLCCGGTGFDRPESGGRHFTTGNAASGFARLLRDDARPEAQSDGVL